MNCKNKILITAAISGLIVSLHAEAVVPNQQVNQAIAGCKGNRGTSFGQMPWGATDQDLISYKGKNLCTNNKGRPIGTNCEKTLEKLYQVASELNKMVKAGCDKYVPIVMQLDSEGKCSGKECLEYNNAEMKAAKAELAKFHGKLKEFSGVMSEQQKYVAQSSENVVQVLEENQNARNTPAYNGAGYSASQMGVSSISESDSLNNFQDAAVAQTIVEGIKTRFADSESRYAKASEANYEKLRRPIEDSFAQVEKLQSRVLREQLHGFLKAEELKLATKLYDNQLSEADSVTDKLTAINKQSVASLNTAGAAAGAAPLLSALGSQFGGANSGGSGYNGSSGGDLSYPANGSGAAVEKGATQLAELANRSGPSTNAEAGEGEAGSVSSASRSPASATSLRESLRKKLAAEKNGGAIDASVAAGGNMAAEGEGAKSAAGKSIGLANDAGFDTNGIALGAGSSDPLLNDFNVGSLDQGGFYIAGSGIEASVKELVGEIESASPNQLSKDIGALDSASLFVRVRELYGRCLKRGCVTGMGKGEI